MQERKESLVGNVADPKQVKQGKKEKRREEQQNVLDLRKVLSSAEGRRLLWRYIGMCNVLGSVVGSRPEETYFNEGMRMVGVTIFNDWQSVSAETLVQMMMESKREVELAKREAEKQKPGEGGEEEEGEEE